MNGTINREVVARKPGYHAGDEIVRAMMINLTTNNANPDAIEAEKEARAIAFANKAKAAPAPEKYSKHDVSNEPRDSNGRWTSGASTTTPKSGPLTKGERVRIKPEFQDKGDDEFEWYVHEDEDGGRVSIFAKDSTMSIQPIQRVESRMIERFH